MRRLITTAVIAIALACSFVATAAKLSAMGRAQ